jgi:hypothetical protein
MSKKIITLLLLCVLVFTGCKPAADTWAVKSNGTEASAQLYCYYLAAGFNKALSADGNITADNLLEKELNGAPAEDYVKTAALQYLKEYFAVKQQLALKGLSISTDEKQALAVDIENEWLSHKDYYETINIPRDTLYEIILLHYEKLLIFNSIYGAGGSEEVTETEIKSYYSGNNYRLRALCVPLSQGDEDSPLPNEIIDSLEKAFNDAITENETDENAINSLAELLITTLGLEVSYAKNDTNSSGGLPPVLAQNFEKNKIPASVYPSGFEEKLAETEVGKAAWFKLGEAYYFVVREDIFAGETDLQQIKTVVLHKLKDVEFVQKLGVWAESVTLEENARMMAKYSAKYIAGKLKEYYAKYQ